MNYEGEVVGLSQRATEGAGPEHDPGIVSFKRAAPEGPSAAAIRWECARIQALLLRKNAAYGDSALSPLRVFSSCGPEEGLRVRIDDKLSRIAQGEDKGGEDAITDLIGYLILLSIARDRKA
jgi:hypothetical protein